MRGQRKNPRKAVQPFENKKRKIDIFKNYEANGVEKIQRKLEIFSTLISKKSIAEKDKDQNADLLKWLKKQSMQSLIDWFDCIELTSLRSDNGTVKQRSGETKRDRLFFTLLGIPGFDETPQNQLKVSP